VRRDCDLVSYFLAFQDVDQWSGAFAETLLPFRHPVQRRNPQRRDRHGLHESQPVRARRPGTRLHRRAAAYSAQDPGRLLGGRAGARGAGRLDALGGWRGLLPRAPRHPLRRQHARRGGHGGRQGRGRDEARLAGGLLAGRPSGRGDEHRHRD